MPEEKRSIHRVAIELLKEDPKRHLETLAELCSRADVPREWNLRLRQAFYEAGIVVTEEAKKKSQEVINNLKRNA
ncbi:hypothetical protein KJA15_03200 [Patescibacteria group bacterium]|nr:hypothetical protein [Patescibacteria group bacterium]